MVQQKINFKNTGWILTGYFASYLLCQFFAYELSAFFLTYKIEYQSLLQIFSIPPTLVLLLLTVYYLKDSLFTRDLSGLAISVKDKRDVFIPILAGLIFAIFVIGLSTLSSDSISSNQEVPAYAQGQAFYIWVLTSILVAPATEEV